MFMDNEPGEERLVADWTLTLEDMFKVEKCRGESNRRWFAVQLCYLRNEGKFLEDFANFPLKIINFVSLQMGLLPVLLMTDPGREATTSSYRLRLQNYLGVQNLTDETEAHLRNLLKQEAVSGKTEKEMSKTARFYLRERKVLLPPLRFFTKLIRESLLFAQEDVFTEVADLLSEEVGTGLEGLLEVENNRSRLFDLKEYPPKATSRAIVKYLEKYHFVNAITKNKIDLSGINPHFGSFNRGVPFSNNKMFWYLLSEAGMIEEKREELRNDETLKRIYNEKFNAVYGLGLVNIIDRPTRDVTQLIKGEELPGRKKISRIIKAEMPKVVCFIGKVTYQKYTGLKDFSFGWQDAIGKSRVFVMHAPLRGEAIVRIRELMEIVRAAQD